MNEKNIATLKPLVAQMARQLIEVMKEKHGVDLLITSGFRSFAEQDALYAQGRTTPGQVVTQAKGGQSFHNYGVAFDCVPLIGGKPNWDSPYTVTALEASTIGLEHGDRGYIDLPHFQCRLGYSLEDFQDGKVDWSKYEVEALPTKQNNIMEENTPVDVTNTSPQILTIKSVTYTWVKTVDGQETVSGSSDLPITDTIVAEVQSMQAPDFNITVTK